MLSCMLYILYIIPGSIWTMDIKETSKILQQRKINTLGRVNIMDIAKIESKRLYRTRMSF